MRPIQADRTQHDITPMGWRGTRSMDEVVKGQKPGRTTIHDAVDPAASHDAARQQRASDLVGSTVQRRPARPGLRGLAGRDVSPDQARAILENGADQLAMRARQYQAFMSGGTPPRLNNWPRTAGNVGNTTQRMLGAGVPLSIRA